MYSRSLERRLVVALLSLAAVVAALALARPAAADCPVGGCGGGGGGVGDPTTYTLTIQVKGVGAVMQGATSLCSIDSGYNTSSTSCTKTYVDGATPTLTGTAGSGYGLSSWSGAGCSGSSSCTPTMDSDKTVTATFIDNSPPPAANITGPAAAPTVTRSDDSPSLTFTTNSDTWSTRCAVDSATRTSCSTPWRLPALTNGTHTLHVQSLDVNGNLIEVSRQISYVNVPDTTLSGTPAEGAVVDTTATDFTLPALALCKLDGTDVSCLSNLSSLLSDGTHTFTVAAGAELNSTGYYDKTPATRHWTVDTQAPDTTISAGPSGSTTQTSADFAFVGTDPPPGTALNYLCRLDGGVWNTCDSSSAQQYPSLGAGSHTFDVKAVDAAGNEDPTPASRTWTVLVDADGDGFFSNTDCNDANPAVHPGAADIPGDGVDQDCSGADTPQGGGGGAQGVLGSGPSSSGALLSAKLGSSFKVKGKRTVIRKLVLTGIPDGAKVKLTCKGKGCPFRSKTFRPKHGSVSLTKAFSHRKLANKAKLSISVTMPGAKAQVFTISMRAGKKPRLKTT